MKMKDFDAPYLRLIPNRNNTAIRIVSLNRRFSDGRSMFGEEYVVVDGDAASIAIQEVKRLRKKYFIREAIMYVVLLVFIVTLSQQGLSALEHTMSESEQKLTSLIALIVGVMFAWGFTLSLTPIPDENIPGARVDEYSFPHLGKEINKEEREILLKTEKDPDLEFQNEIRARINEEAEKRIAVYKARRKALLKERTERYFTQP